MLDIVPNHMAVPTPVWHNRALWSVLAEGADSPYADWFDVDWSAGDGARAHAGARRPHRRRAGPRRAGAGRGRDPRRGHADRPALPRPRVPGPRRARSRCPWRSWSERQHYRLAYWRVADEELNYRRFFDVGTLLAVRVEDPAVFDATHALVLSLLADGTIDGLRIDHPDGLADPAGYLARLREASGGAWVVVEKILEGTETLPPDWETAGTHRLRGAVADPGDVRRPGRRRGARRRHAPADGRHVRRVRRRWPSRPSGRSSTGPCTRRCTG